MPEKRCTGCWRVKPLSHFAVERRRKDGRRARCKTCKRIEACMYRETEQYRRARDAWNARPEVRERERRRRLESEAHRACVRAYNKGPKGRVIRGRSNARKRLREATDPARIAELLRLIGLYDARLKELDVRPKELMREPDRLGLRRAKRQRQQRQRRREATTS